MYYDDPLYIDHNIQSQPSWLVWCVYQRACCAFPHLVGRRLILKWWKQPSYWCWCDHLGLLFTIDCSMVPRRPMTRLGCYRVGGVMSILSRRRIVMRRKRGILAVGGYVEYHRRSSHVHNFMMGNRVSSLLLCIDRWTHISSWCLDQHFATAFFLQNKPPWLLFLE